MANTLNLFRWGVGFIDWLDLIHRAQNHSRYEKRHNRASDCNPVRYNEYARAISNCTNQSNATGVTRLYRRPQSNVWRKRHQQMDVSQTNSAAYKSVMAISTHATFRLGVILLGLTRTR